MEANVVGIMCPARDAAKFNSDYYDLGKVAGVNNKDIRYFKNIKDEAEWIAARKPDVVFVLGLSQIIPQEILNIPTLGCIGSNPALLPENRGRHPIIWAIANGLEKSGITLFWIDEGVDSGDIWKQEEFSIDIDDDASMILSLIHISEPTRPY
jgi:methionyl-tRNA formyltransferase